MASAVGWSLPPVNCPLKPQTDRVASPLYLITCSQYPWTLFLVIIETCEIVMISFIFSEYFICSLLIFFRTGHFFKSDLFIGPPDPTVTFQLSWSFRGFSKAELPVYFPWKVWKTASSSHPVRETDGRWKIYFFNYRERAFY